MADKLSTLKALTVKAQLRWSLREISAMLRIGNYSIRSDRQREDLLEEAGEASFEQGMLEISCILLELIILSGSILTLTQTTLSMTETAMRILRFLRLSRTLKMMIMPFKNWRKNLLRIWGLEEVELQLEDV